VVQAPFPGAAVIIGGLPSNMNLCEVRPPYGSLETNLHTEAAVDIARCCDLLFMGTTGAKREDAQAGFEAANQV